jgi:hypothetical protein
VTTPNPPIPGHHLLSEGSVWRKPRDDRFPYSYDPKEIEHEGGCQCGARPPEFPNVSRKAMQRWHREHKAELRRAAFGGQHVSIDDVVLMLEGGTERMDVVHLLHQVLNDAEEALRLGDHEKVLKIIFVWSQRREHLLAGEERWEDQHV